MQDPFIEEAQEIRSDCLCPGYFVLGPDLMNDLVYPEYKMG